MSLVFLWIYRPLVWGEANLQWDADGQFSSWFMLVGDFARAGQWLTWDPWSNGGTPVWTDPQWATQSPLHVFFAWLLHDLGELGFRWFALGMWLLGGIGVLPLARHFGAPWRIAAALALAFLLSGAVVQHAQHTPFQVAIAGLPWVWWRLDVALVRGRFWPAVEAAALAALFGLGGYPGVVISNALFLGLWSLGRIVASRGSSGVQDRADGQSSASPPGWASWRERLTAARRPLLVASVCVLCTAVLLGPLYLGFAYDNAGFTERSGGLPHDTAVLTNRAIPKSLLSLTTPYYKAFHMQGHYLVHWNPEGWPDGVHPTDYRLGLVMTVLMVIGIFPFTRRTANEPGDPLNHCRWLAVALALLGIGLTLSSTLPLRSWLYEIFIPSRYFRHPVIFRSWLLYAAIPLAVMGWKTLEHLWRAAPEDKSRRRVAMLTALLLGVGVLWMIGGTIVLTTEQPQGPAPALVWAWLIVTGIAIAALSLWILRVGMGRPAAIDPLMNAILITAVVGTLASGWMTRSQVYVDVDNSQGQSLRDAWTELEQKAVDSVQYQSMNRMLKCRIAIRVTPTLVGPFSAHNRHLLIKQAVLFSYTPTSHSLHEGLRQRDDIVVNALLGDQRIWYTPEEAVTWASVHSDVEEAWAERTVELGAPPVVLHARASMLNQGKEQPTDTQLQEAAAQIATLPAAERIDFTMQPSRADEHRLTLESPGVGYLWITDHWARGWQATVNGEPAEVLGANFIWRAIKIPAGHVELDFRYTPLFPGWVTWLQWAVMLLIALPATWQFTSALFKPGDPVAADAA